MFSVICKNSHGFYCLLLQLLHAKKLMKYTDQNLSNELRELKDKQIDKRWFQLYVLSKEASDSAIKYLFATNAGGTIAVLAYLGSISDSGSPALLEKIALSLFFSGLLFVGIYKAYMVHNLEGLFEYYQSLVGKYYEGKIGWGDFLKADETKVGKALTPYILSYISFASFIGGCFSGAFSFL